MARIIFESGIREIHGSMGSFTYRKNPDGSISIIRSRIPNPDRPVSQGQLDHQQQFREAVARSRLFMQQPETLAAYREISLRRGPMARLHATIVGDILRPPTIRNLDLSGYHGAAGQPIRVLADDNVGVKRLTLAISDSGGGQVYETAEKLFSGPNLATTVVWEYTATMAVPVGQTALVTVTAYDLAGNYDQASQPVT